MPDLPPLPPPLSNVQLEARVAGASAEDLRRALRIVLGAEQAYWERDFDADTTWYSPRFFDILGLPPTQDRELINARIHPEDRPQFEAAYAAAVAEGGAFSYDVRYRDLNGHYRWARAVGRVWLDDRDGRPRRLIGTIVDVHAERQARLDADAHAQRYRRALDAASEAHFERSVGLDEFFVSSNVMQLLGYPPGTPLPDRETFMSWVHPADQPRVLAELQRAWRAPGTWNATYRLRRAEGGWRWFHGRGRTAPDEQGRMRMSGMVGDVHQQQLDRQELDQHRHHLRAMVAARTEELDAALAEARSQRAQAERASQAKGEFLAHMSHELRTPLNGLLGMTELALKVAADPVQQRYLQVALDSGRALLQVINEVLDLSRLEAGSIGLESRPFDLAELLADVVRALIPSVGTRPVLMRYDWSGEMTAVVGDAARVRQIVTNLTVNALKFTDNGCVTVSAALEPQAGHAGLAHAVVRIEDTGPGIDPSQQERVFEPFVQADASLTRQHGGSGLGLPIARRLAREMGGDVTLERSDANGSCFKFAWPAPYAPGAAAVPAVAPGRAWAVFPDADSARWISRRIVGQGWRCDPVAGLAAAIERAGGLHTADEAPQVVIVAARSLSTVDDFAALRRVLPEARMVLLVRADWDQPAIESAAMAQGAQTKVMPLTPRDLVSILQPAPPPAPASPPLAPPPASRARVLVVEDNTVNLLITEEFLRLLGHEPVGAADGAAAIEACEAQAPDIVLMDLQMPVMDGFEATRRLRALQAAGRLRSFPIVALSAHAGEADRRQGEACGMDDYITKPILLDALRAALERWLGSRR